MTPQPPQGGAIIIKMEEKDKIMYFGAKPETFETARILRKRATVYEKLLWEKLKLKQICGKRFRRQHPVDFFIVDFYCHEAKLVVELDGEIHKNQKEYDEGRSAEMEKYSIKVIRFKNSDVENNIENVVNQIENEVRKRILKSPLGDLGVKKPKLESSNKKPGGGSQV